MTRRARPARSAPRCVLDSGGLTALLGPSQRARAWLRWLVEHGGTITLPTPVLVETTTGHAGRDAEVNRLLGALERAASVLASPTEATARLAGRLRYRARSYGDVGGIDALVAAEAAAGGAPCVLLTSDPGDLSRLLANEGQVVVTPV